MNKANKSKTNLNQTGTTTKSGVAGGDSRHLRTPTTNTTNQSTFKNESKLTKESERFLDNLGTTNVAARDKKKAAARKDATEEGELSLAKGSSRRAAKRVKRRSSGETTTSPRSASASSASSSSSQRSDSDADETGTRNEVRLKTVFFLSFYFI